MLFISSLKIPNTYDPFLGVWVAQAEGGKGSSPQQLAQEPCAAPHGLLQTLPPPCKQSFY